VSEINIVVETALHRWPGRELGVGPELGNGSREDVGTGVPESLEFSHLISLFQRFSLLLLRIRHSEKVSGPQRTYFTAITNGKAPYSHANEPYS
jgi:hypothetical protein